MKWLRRTDHARRTKGDPPPTYQELEATVAELAKKLADAVAANTSLHERNERLHNDLAAMRERLPRVADDVQPLTLGSLRRVVERWPFAPDIKPVREVEG